VDKINNSANDRLFSVEEMEVMLDPSHAEKLFRAFEIALASQLLDTMRENARLRGAIKPIAAWPIVANGRIVGDENQWNDIVVKARQALSNKDSLPPEIQAFKDDLLDKIKPGEWEIEAKITTQNSAEKFEKDSAEKFESAT